jgi:AraC-like DNA-binding protein
MPAAVSSPPPTQRRSASRRARHTQSPVPLRTPSRRSEGILASRPLSSYVDAAGRARELLAIPGSAGSVLVLDRDAATLRDRRLIAHLAADEPYENAALVCRHYLEDAHGRWCRQVRREDLEVPPFAQSRHDVPPTGSQARDTQVADMEGNLYRLLVLSSAGRPSAQLRWCRHSADVERPEWERVGMRDVVAALESYEPMRTLTEQAIARHRNDPSVGLTRLCSELERLCASPVVLNRGLREAVLDAVNRCGTSMSEIALRCGIVKHDRRGRASGETSWLARRVGIMPEGGETKITPWVHTDVLAVIARKGLGVSPREVELQ